MSYIIPGDTVHLYSKDGGALCVGTGVLLARRDVLATTSQRDAFDDSDPIGCDGLARTHNPVNVDGRVRWFRRDEIEPARPL